MLCSCTWAKLCSVQAVPEQISLMNRAFSSHQAVGLLPAFVALGFNLVPAAGIPRGTRGLSFPARRGPLGKVEGRRLRSRRCAAGSAASARAGSGRGTQKSASCVHARTFNCVKVDGEQAANAAVARESRLWAFQRAGGDRKACDCLWLLACGFVGCHRWGQAAQGAAVELAAWCPARPPWAGCGPTGCGPVPVGTWQRGAGGAVAVRGCVCLCCADKGHGVLPFEFLAP